MRLFLFVLAAVHCAPQPAPGAAPTDNPAAALKLPWIAALPWRTVVDITTMPGRTPAGKLAAAQEKAAAAGGGVVFFPAGEYQFDDHIRLRDGVILRGAPPAPGADARKDGYALGTRFEFPRYRFKAEGQGTPLDSAFKAILLEDPAGASNCGVVHLAINRGHILFGQGEGGACGKNRVVLGCVIRNAAYADPAVPDAAIGQHAWQRHTWRFGAAIDVKSVENLLIAHNRLPRSGDDDFTMNGYVVQANERGKGKAAVAIDGVRFDYDNRPGIYANHFAVGGPGGVGPNGTPETHPEGFRKGTVMHGNYVFSTGRCAIGFSGDGTVATGNVIRFAKDAWRPTATGRDRTSGSSTNDTRAMEIRGWRWDVSDNDYEVHRNWAYDRKYPINDGEGLMHEDHCNSSIRDSVMRGNRGNAYLSLYKTAGIDGLLIEGNDIRPPGGASSIAPIFVSANRTREPFPIRNVTIRGNTTNGAILIEGKPGENNLVEGNQFVGQGEGVIQNRASATVRDNRGFKEANQPE